MTVPTEWSYKAQSNKSLDKGKKVLQAMGVSKVVGLQSAGPSGVNKGTEFLACHENPNNLSVVGLENISPKNRTLVQVQEASKSVETIGSPRNGLEASGSNITGGINSKRKNADLVTSSVSSRIRSSKGTKEKTRRLRPEEGCAQKVKNGKKGSLAKLLQGPISESLMRKAIIKQRKLKGAASSSSGGQEFIQLQTILPRRK